MCPSSELRSHQEKSYTENYMPEDTPEDQMTEEEYYRGMAEATAENDVAYEVSPNVPRSKSLPLPCGEGA